MNKRLLTILALPFSALIVTGCGGSSSSGASDVGSGGGGNDGSNGAKIIHGTAATGAPYTGSDTIHIICKGNDGGPMIVDADAEGNFSLSKERFDSGDSQFPCTIDLQGGGLSTYTNQSGRINLTPFTTLAFTRAVMDFSGQALGMLDVDIVDTTVFAARLNTATEDVKTALKKASGENDVPFDIFTETFKADHNSVYDRWLDGFGDALKQDYPLSNPSFFDAFLSFPLMYSAKEDPTDFNEPTSESSFSFTIPVPRDVALLFQNALGAGDYTLDIGITRAGSLDPINETVDDVALPTTATEMCNKLQSHSIELITDGRRYTNTRTTCAWATNPVYDADEEAIVNYCPVGQAVFRWKQK